MSLRRANRLQKNNGAYFFSSAGADGGALATGGFTGWLAWVGCCGSPRIPSLNSRTPCPKPFITSGILRPPKRTRTTIAIINKCMGLSHIGYLPFALKLNQLGPPDVTVYRIKYSTSMAGKLFAESRYRRRRDEAISLAIARAASRGLAACVMGLPTTR